MNLYYSICVLGMLVTFEGFDFDEVVITPVNASIYENDSVTLSWAIEFADNEGSDWYLTHEKKTTIVGVLDSSCKDISNTNIDTSLYEYSCPNSTQVTLTIKKVTRKNHGDRLSCSIYTSSGTQASGYTFLNVQVPVSSASIIVPNTSEVTLMEKTEEVFKCKTSGGLPEATVTWYKDPGTPDIISDDVEITSNIETSSSNVDNLIEITSTLRYSPSRNDNGWRIYCTASNILGRDPAISELKLLLNVHYEAFITLFAIEGNFEDENEEKIQLTCAVDSNPASTVKIMSEGNMLKEESNITTLSVIQQSNVACLYRGDYTCEASNTYGHKSSKNITLFVKCSSNTFLCNIETNTGIILGCTLGIVCAVLALYGTFITILYRTKRKNTDETTANEPVEQRTYGNLNVTETHATNEEHAENNEDEDDTVRQYTDLIQYSNLDRATYEVIQSAN